jgi:hypothetical protein
MAINQSTGDVYVADTGNNRVEEFDSAGKFVLAFGQGVDTNPSAANPNVCTAASGDTCGPGAAGGGPGQFTTAAFVAVDNDASSPSFGDVYVGDTGDNLVQKFDPSGNLITVWGDGGGVACGAANGQLAGACAPGGPFAPIAGIAVNATGDLLVLQNGCGTPAFEFAPDGTPVAAVPTARCHAPAGLSVNTSGDLFKVNGDGSVEKLDASGADIGTVTPDIGSNIPPAAAITIDPATGDLYVATASGFSHYAFDSSGQVLEPGGSACAPAANVGCDATDMLTLAFAPSGIAIDAATGDTFVANPSTGQLFEYGPLVTVPDVSTDTPSAVGPSSATFNGTVNPDGTTVTDCHFQYVADSSYQPAAADPYSAGGTLPCSQSVGSTTASISVSAPIAGLQEGVAYDFRLVAADANGFNDATNQRFTTATPPAIDSANAASLTASTAELRAAINPDNGDTKYHFEYGTTTNYGGSVPIPDADLGAGSVDVNSSQTVGGLTPNTEYHWRVVATNPAGTVTSPDHTFLYDTSSPGLPDGRAYEMVTPAGKNGATIGAGFLVIPPEVAANGSQMIAMSLQCFGAAGSCNANRQYEGEPVEFARTASGWTATPLAPPAAEFPHGNSPWQFDPDTDAGLFTMPTDANNEADVWYLRNPASGTFSEIGPVYPSSFGSSQGTVPYGSVTRLTTPDMSHLVWDEQSPVLWPFDATTSLGSVYEYVGTGEPQPALVGVSGGADATDLISLCGTSVGNSSINSYEPGALSENGQTVFFTAHACAGGSGDNANTAVPADTLYARIDNARTVLISGRSPTDCDAACHSSPAANAEFVQASTDGSRALFLSTQQLTTGASEDVQDQAGSDCVGLTGPNGCNLYLYDFSASSGRNLVDVSAGDTSGAGPEVQGVLGMSADGTHDYFVARGVLTSEPNAQGQSAQAGQDNLYAYQLDAVHPSGQIAFVASLPDADSSEWSESDQFDANITPDGRYLVFRSSGDLTADDHATGVLQLFRYDSQTGQLLRLSIGNRGYNDNGNDAVANTVIVPASQSLYGYRGDPTMSDDGTRVFFRTPTGLTSQALDDAVTDSEGDVAENVYEWEQAGVGSCPGDQATGCVFLISDGQDTGPSTTPCSNGTISSVCLIGSDDTGANVFFTSSDALVPQDTDGGQLNVYDARVGGGFPYSPPPAGCDVDSCQGSPGPQPAPPPAATVIFTGPGSQLSAGRARSPKAGLARIASASGSTLTLRVTVPAAGTLRITGNQIRTLQTILHRRGTYTLRVRLRTRARQTLRRHRLKLSLRLTYQTAGRAPSNRTLAVDVRRER